MNFNYPELAEEISIDNKAIEDIKRLLSIQIRTSEGIVTDQSIDIFADFVTLCLRFSKFEKIEFDNYKLFQKDCLIIGEPGAGID